jgi:hypothetical protein
VAEDRHEDMTGATADHDLLVDLVAFVDDEHEYRDGGCHPQPGVDCYEWCEACKLIARVPADVLAEARQKLRAEGYER